MLIAKSILDQYPDLNDAQRSIVAHADGPLLVIAGPGSGKTYSIVLRALNLLLLGKASPRQIVPCTFTEKAAFEMRIAYSLRRGRFAMEGIYPSCVFQPFTVSATRSSHNIAIVLMNQGAV